MSADIEKVKEKYTTRLMRLPNVVGVGIGKGKAGPMIKVFVVRKIPLTLMASHEVVPSVLDGYPVEVEEIGEVNAQPKDGGNGA